MFLSFSFFPRAGNWNVPHFFGHTTELCLRCAQRCICVSLFCSRFNEHCVCWVKTKFSTSLLPFQGYGCYCYCCIAIYMFSGWYIRAYLVWCCELFSQHFSAFSQFPSFPISYGTFRGSMWCGKSFVGCYVQFNRDYQSARFVCGFFFSIANIYHLGIVKFVEISSENCEHNILINVEFVIENIYGLLNLFVSWLIDSDLVWKFYEIVPLHRSCRSKVNIFWKQQNNISAKTFNHKVIRTVTIIVIEKLRLNCLMRMCGKKE